MERFNYEQVRASIQDGDILLIKGIDGFLTPFTKFFTRSPLTHAGVAFWIDGELWMAEINGGKNHAIPVSQLVEEFDVMYAPGLDPAKLRASIYAALRVRTHYGYPALFMSGLLDFFRIKLFVHWRKILVCSGWCVMVLEDAGFPETTYILSPADLALLLVGRFTVNAK